MEHQEQLNNPEDENLLPTSLEGIIATLTVRGCPDLTSSIDLDTFGNNPCTGGGLCDVYRGALHGGTIVAIKSLKIDASQLEQESEKQKLLRSAAKELIHWSKLSHRNVLPLLGLAMFRGYLSMISPWMENGDLASYISKHPGADRLRLCKEVCTGLSYIHSVGMVHGDLKGKNVMVSSDGVAMISDFGSAQVKDLTLKFSNTQGGIFTIRWAAPELLTVGARGSKEADVWAYGMTVLEVLTGTYPYYGENEMRVLRLIAIEKRPPSRPLVAAISDGLWDLLNACWDTEPSNRPEITSVSERLALLFP